MKRGTKVDVYFNLKTRLWSIRHKGIVVKHAEAVTIQNARAVVSAPGRARVIREKRRTVHAVIRGEYVEAFVRRRNGIEAVSYNPFTADHFYRVADMSPWLSGDRVYFTAGRAWVARVPSC